MTTLSPVRLRPHRTTAICTSASYERGITTLVSPDLHDRFEQLALARGMTKAKLMRRLIEAVVKNPELLATMLEGERT